MSAKTITVYLSKVRLETYEKNVGKYNEIARDALKKAVDEDCRGNKDEV